MQLNELHIQNFRCFTDYRITFASGLTVLFGKNGTGKTTLIHAIHKALSFAFKRDKEEKALNLGAGFPDLKPRDYSKTDMRVPHSKVFPLIGTCMPPPPPLRCSQVSLEKHPCV